MNNFYGGPKFDYPTFRNATDPNGVEASRVFHVTSNKQSWPDNQFVNIPGKVDSRFSVGKIVTVVTPTTTFTGPIWYIYQGSTSYNIYVRTERAPEIKDADYAMVYIGSTAPQTTIAQQQEQAESESAVKTNQETTTSVVPKKTDAKPTTTSMGPKTTEKVKKSIPVALILLSLLAAYFLLRKKLGKKGK